MIRYTGNPYVDAGVAVLELRLRKPCAKFTLDDLAVQTKEITREYSRPLWKSYLMVHLPNCAWTQKDLSSEKNQAYLNKVLQSYKPEFPELDRRCSFCGRPAKIFADRRYIPLLTGETVMTSGTGGVPGLPVCGWCVFAVHFYPFATLKVEGRPLFWWASDSRWTLRLTAIFVHKLESILAMSAEEIPKMRWPSTRLLEAARQAMEKVEMDGLPSPERPPLSDVIGIHATNYGTDPNFEELRIPRGLLEFWKEAGTYEAYREMERRAWDDPSKPTKGGKGKKKKSEDARSAQEKETPEFSRKNRLYEALGGAFRSDDYREKAKHIATQFFLRRQDANVAPGTLAVAELFLEKVADMERERLNSIRDLADHIADHLIIGAGERKIAQQLVRRKLRMGELFQLLSKIQRKLSDIGKPLQWEKVLLALNLANDEDRTASDYWLVQELILIRMYERLANSPILAELPESEDLPGPEANGQIN
jgi:CRISPR-associated protein Cst1